jgi:hypothetical protein
LVRAAKTWLAEKKYELLEKLSERLRADPTLLPERYGEEPYDVLITFLVKSYGIPEPTDPREEQLRSWAAARPQSALANIALAQHLVNVAWEGRGSGPATTVTEEGWKIFDENIEWAREILEPVVAEENPPPKAYTLLFGVAMAQSWERDRVQPHIEKLLRLYPEYHAAHAVVAQMRMPRWGGEPEDSEVYASSVAEHIGGKPGLAVYAQVAAALRPYHDRTEFFDMTGFDYEKITQGFEHIAVQTPVDLQALFEAILFAEMAGDNEQARFFLAKLQQHEPLWQHSLGDYLDRYRSLVQWSKAE